MWRAIKPLFAFGFGIYMIISGFLDGDFFVYPIMGALLVGWAVLDILSEKNNKFYKVARIYGSVVGVVIIIFGIIGAIAYPGLFFYIIIATGILALLTNLLPMILNKDHDESGDIPTRTLE